MLRTPGATNLASYKYLGLGTVVRITYAEPSVWLDLWGGTSGVFAGLDVFNRVIDQNWQNNITGTPTDIDRYKYGYDQNSNRIWKANVVGTAAVSAGLDEFYGYDPLNRLTEMQRGVLNSGKTAITGTPSREMDYTLDPTGNWSAYLTKTSGTTDLNQTRSHNTVNEITAFSSTPAWAAPPAYDAAGNMTSFPQPANPTSAFSATYDAWNRMVSVSNTSGSVAVYQYDGRNRRIVKDTAAISETRHIYWTTNWQDIEERVGTATTMDKQYVWAALSMIEARSGYIDQLVCRDDATPRRLYACQDANFNLTAITDTSGTVTERYAFDPYGTRAIYDGTWASRSTSGYSWVVGHQGLMHDGETGLLYVRLRNASPAFGRWAERDALGDTDGTNLYEYELGNPVNGNDPSGLIVQLPKRPKKPCCTPAQARQQQKDYGDCMNAVDALVGAELLELDINYAALLSTIAANRAACVSQCSSACGTPSTWGHSSCVFSCKLACGSVAYAAEIAAWAAYEGAADIIKANALDGYGRCHELFPCAKITYRPPFDP